VETVAKAEIEGRTLNAASHNPQSPSLNDSSDPLDEPVLSHW
jgi:hypothetical protein